MKPFKFLRINEFTLDEEWYETYQPYILPYQRTDELFVEMEDRDTGEHFGIPNLMREQIFRKGREIFGRDDIIGGERYRYGGYEYWIDNVYRTIATEDTLVIECLIMVPNIAGGETYHRIIERIRYE